MSYLPSSLNPTAHKGEVDGLPFASEAVAMAQRPAHSAAAPGAVILSFLAALKSLAPQVIVVAAYGQLLRPALLAIPPLGCINVHASLLPKYRGAAPVNWALIRGERMTGVTIMLIDETLDTGAILLQSEIAIDPTDDAGTLQERLAVCGAETLMCALHGMESGALTASAARPCSGHLCPKVAEGRWPDRLESTGDRPGQSHPRRDTLARSDDHASRQAIARLARDTDGDLRWRAGRVGWRRSMRSAPGLRLGRVRSCSLRCNRQAVVGWLQRPMRAAMGCALEMSWGHAELNQHSGIRCGSLLSEFSVAWRRRERSPTSSLSRSAVAHGLTPQGRAFLRELAYGVLRWRNRLDWMLQHCSDHPLETSDPCCSQPPPARRVPALLHGPHSALCCRQ